MFRGDGHYARPEAMAWCEDNGVDYVFGLPGTKPLSKKVDETADAVRTERAVDDKAGRARLRRDAPQGQILDPRAARRRPHRGHHARPRHPLRRHQFRSRLGGMDLRQPVLRARSGREPDQAAQDATRLGSHVLPLRARQPGPPRAAHRRLLADAHRPRRHSQERDLAKAEFATLRLRLLKIAARVVETASRVRLAFAAACPEADLFRSLPGASCCSDRERRGIRPFQPSRSLQRVPKNTGLDGEKPDGAARPNSTTAKINAEKPAFMNKGG